MFPLRMVFAFIAFGFTLISAWNGFNFYRVLFGLAMAILISTTFEIARFTCLFRYMQEGSRMGTLTVVFYMITASVCAFASVNSFTSGVIRQNRSNEKELQQQIYRVRNAYMTKTGEKMVSFNKDIKYLENMVAKYPNSSYWKRRLEQVMENRDSFVTERDRFLNREPENPEQWIRVESARLGIEIGQMTGKSEEVISVKQALRDLWGIDEMTAQKIMGIIVTIVVELSILLLAILATKEKAPVTITKKTMNRKKLIAKANAIFGEKLVYKFLAATRESFIKTGKLPHRSHLTRDIRTIRLHFEDYDPECLKTLY
jgi:hypothetical protein